MQTFDELLEEYKKKKPEMVERAIKEAHKEESEILRNVSETAKGLRDIGLMNEETFKLIFEVCNGEPNRGIRNRS